MANEGGGTPEGIRRKHDDVGENRHQHTGDRRTRVKPATTEADGVATRTWSGKTKDKKGWRRRGDGMGRAVPWMTIGYMVATELKASRTGRGRRWTLTAKRLVKLLMLLLGADTANSVAVPTTPMELTPPPLGGNTRGSYGSC